MKRIGIILFALLLTGCGFHLRGSSYFPPAIHQLDLQSTTPHSEFSRTLKKMFAFSHIHLRTTHPTWILHITAENFDSVAQAGNNNNQQQLVTFTVSYYLENTATHVIYAMKRVRVASIASSNDYIIQTSNSMQDVVQQRLVQEAAAILMQQLAIQLR